ncbi:DNA-invertase hin [Caloramator mitchellensis]|uniref:DNA-invertase hin n=1 Tax=Caloramator mitchellensis TaxID=908809 RepID=A0A0R3JWA2_CALMK|nr:recombinase family protein [Caloramator mitchellensis]KRQ87800.1 DNA-invertase hin [Caloramator mitchellensis]
MKVAAIYSRKSKYTGKGESIDNQISICKDYLERMGISDYLIYEDEGFSGKNVKRPEFQRMLKDAKAKKFDVLICYRLDRVSRNIADFAHLIELLEKYTINFISVSEQFDTSSPMGRAMMYIASVFAQLERETIAERIKDNMLELAKGGRWLGGETPTGFKSVPIIYNDKDGKQKKMFKLEPIKEELEMVKLIFQLYLKHKSLSQVEKYLLKNNIKTKNSTDFVKMKIKTILNNPAYVKATKEVFDYIESKGITVIGEPNGINGLLLYNKRKGKGELKDKSLWVCAVAKHEGIIEAKDWIEVQKILEKNKEKAPRLGNSKFGLLSGIIRCAKCKSTMKVIYGVLNEKTGEKPHYYSCTMKLNSGKTRCSNKNAKGDEIEEYVIGTLKNLSLDKEKLINELLKYQESLSSKSLKDEVEVINSQIRQNEKSIDNLTNTLSLTDDSNLSKILLQKIDSLSKENLNLNKKLQELKDTHQLEVARKKKIEEFAKSVKRFETLFESASFEDKKMLLKDIIDTIYWDGDSQTIDIKYKEAGD